MNPTLPEIPVVPALDDEAVRRDVIGSARPAILRGWVKAWPSVAAGRRSPAALVEYLRGFDNGAPVDAIMTPPEVEGRVFYDAAMNGFNFIRNRLPISAIAEQVMRYSAIPAAAGGRGAERADPRLPSRVRRRESPERSARTCLTADLARQCHHDAGASR